MKRGTRLRIFWIVVSILAIGSMIIFTVLPLLNSQTF
jgi:hypothetical protein